MGRARRWASLALFGLVMVSLCLGAASLALAAQAGTEVLDWNVSGSLDLGGIYTWGDNGSAAFNKYRDMDSGFVGEFSLRGEKKESPYFFDVWMRNPARDDQAYEGAFGRYDWFRLDLGWNETPVVMSNTAQTIWQQNGATFNLPAPLRPTITSIYNPPLPANAATCAAGAVYPCPPASAANAALINNIKNTTYGLLRPVDLSYDTNVGFIDLKLTPTDEWRFDLGWENLTREGYRPAGVVIGSPGGSIMELGIPIQNSTNEARVGIQYARPDWALQFQYTGSWFNNEYAAYTWDNTLSVTDSATAASLGQVSAPPDNYANTFNLTGTLALPLRTRINGNFSYTMLRQDATFLNNIPYTAAGITQRNFDDAGNTSPDAEANLINANLLATSRPINNVTATAWYRYMDYQNNLPLHTFSFSYPEGIGPAQVHSTLQEDYITQNTGVDIGWHPISMLNLKAGYNYVHWNRGDREVTSTDENIGKFSADVTPAEWFLGRVSYTYGDRSVDNYQNVPAQLPQLRKFDEADRHSQRADLLAQFTWQTVTLGIPFAWAMNTYPDSAYGLKKSTYYAPGVSLGWSPLERLQFTADYTYEHYSNDLQSRYRTPTDNTQGNDWLTQSTDEFQTLGLNLILTAIPKKLDFTLGYALSLGYTTINTNNAVVPPATPSSTSPAPPGTAPGITPNNATAFNWDKVENVLQTIKIVGRYLITEKLQARLGFAYEWYTEKDFARDPMAPFVGDVDNSNAGIQIVTLGARVPNYDAFIFSAFLKYDF